jgi:hypothetical protein
MPSTQSSTYMNERICSPSPQTYIEKNVTRVGAFEVEDFAL